MAGERIRFGDILLKKKLITSEQLQAAIDYQNQTGGKLGAVLVDLGYVSEEQLLSALAEQLGYPFIDLSHYQLDPKTIQLIPEIQARQFRVIALRDEADFVLLGMVDPQDILAIDTIETIVAKPIKPALVQVSTMLRAFDSFYDNSGEINQFAEALSVELNHDVEALFEAVPSEDDMPVVKLLQSIFEQAVRYHASDVHIEPTEQALIIRTRVDGQLQEQILNEKQIVGALTQRLKLMSKLNIAEKRLPQDGRFQIKVGDVPIDVRLSTLPTVHGESVVMRLLPQSKQSWSLDLIDMPEYVLAHFRALIHRPHGMILVTGPTGSGKTTTLYGTLAELNKPEIKIITVEDPVEYRLTRICQVQINPRVDLTFARVLRAALRQDPDILMVGEIRDAESASIAMRAAMTGHLVLATLHTTDASASAIRLIDMGVPAYLVATALRGVLAQRLVRKICEHCKQYYVLSHQEDIWLKSMLGHDTSNMKFYLGRGCTRCANTGYRGRTGIYELLEMNQNMMDALRHGDHVAFEKAVDEAPGHQTLNQSAIALAATGVTSIQEVLRVAEILPDLDYQDDLGSSADSHEDNS